MLGPHGDADARADLDPNRFDDEGGIEHVLQAMSELHCFVRVRGGGQQHREFVAPEASHGGITAHGPLKTQRHRLQ